MNGRIISLAACLGWMWSAAVWPACGADQELPLVITHDTQLDPAKTYGPIVIGASGITVDGRGAWLVGATAGPAREYQGVAVTARGVSHVTLRNVRAKGWETGLQIEDGSHWTVENCDFSDNFHDPDFGWGENGRRGGIVLDRVHHSMFRSNRANRVWDACVLIASHDNTLSGNDFSHTSNTCLKMWNSCRNRVLQNDLSYGLRISPGEVHARDSTCVLLESGSNDNHFLENNCTHGGDGVFVRALNGWVSSGNVFERNDASYAHNNCFEAWCPRNRYVGNKANHGSYGFWLGASDQTVLLDNEASYNGLPDGHHNSPHLPDGTHAGIVFMFGPSSHTIARGNTCVGNHGAGIAVCGDVDSAGQKWRAYHWIIQQNELRDNRWGVYLEYADWIDLAANRFANNGEDIHVARGVTRLTRYPDNPAIQHSPQVSLAGPAFGAVGQPVTWDAAASRDPDGHPLTFRWDLGDGTVAAEPRVTHTFSAPGFYRVGLTVNNGLLSDLAWRDFYVVDAGAEWGTEQVASAWGWIDPQSEVQFADDPAGIAGRFAVRALVQPYSGMMVHLLYPQSRDAAVPLAGKTRLVFWLRALNENLPAWQGPQPVVTLYESDERFAVLTPKQDLLSSRPNNEEREGWSYFVVPLAGNDQWERTGDLPKTLNFVTIGCDSWGAPPLQIWIDGMSLQ
ncbi:MAG: right-handed parallel beta-helix repeat-containing protein [Pirellulaceae bacterium]|nr:right-handed parallel beta-helix repeat-containing protein [Pirellulaceae bacterium]